MKLPNKAAVMARHVSLLDATSAYAWAAECPDRRRRERERRFWRRVARIKAS